MTSSAYWHAHKEELTEKHRQWATQQRARGSLAMKRHELKKHGITLEQFFEMFDAQNGECAICGHNDWQDGLEVPHVDHCHATGRIRGLLCAACNHMLGKAQDNPERLYRAAEYLALKGAKLEDEE